MMQALNIAFWISVLTMTFRMATPLLLGTVGEAFAERSGILNLGIEGMMLMGASVGFLMGYITGNLWLGVLMAGISGMVLGVLMAFLTVTLGAQQHVAGLGITIMSSGLSFYLYRLNVPTPGGIPITVKSFEPIKVPLLADLPILGPIFFNQYELVYISIIIAIVSFYLLYKTDWGLKIRAVGENPRAADTVGINVFRVRYICLTYAGGLAGIAGSWLSLAQSGMFLPGMTTGRGWICIALVVFGFWNPLRILGGAMLFGGIDAFQLSLQAVGFKIPYQLFLMMPHVFTIIALILVSRRAIYPRALLKPYRRE